MLPTRQDLYDLFRFRCKLIIEKEVLENDNYDDIVKKSSKKIEETRKYIEQSDSIIESLKNANDDIKKLLKLKI